MKNPRKAQGKVTYGSTAIKQDVIRTALHESPLRCSDYVVKSPPQLLTRRAGQKRLPNTHSFHSAGIGRCVSRKMHGSHAPERTSGLAQYRQRPIGSEASGSRWA